MIGGAREKTKLMFPGKESYGGKRSLLKTSALKTGSYWDRRKKENLAEKDDR